MLSDQHRSPVAFACNQPAPLVPHGQQKLQQQLPLPWAQRLSWPEPRLAAGLCAGSWWNGSDPTPSHEQPGTGRHFTKAYKLWVNKMKILDTFANLVCDWFSSCITSVPRPRALCQGCHHLLVSWAVTPSRTALCQHHSLLLAHCSLCAMAINEMQWSLPALKDSTCKLVLQYISKHIEQFQQGEAFPSKFWSAEKQGTNSSNCTKAVQGGISFTSFLAGNLEIKS